MPLPPASAAVARALFRLARAADAAAVPLPADLSVCGSAVAARSMLRLELEAGDVDAAFATLRRADAQIAFLAATPPAVRADLAVWHGLLATGEGATAGRTPHAAAFAAGARALLRMCRPPPRPPWAQDDEDGDLHDDLSDDEVVSDAAAAVAAAAGVRGDARASLSPTDATTLASSFASVVKPRALPFEWLYEGLAPLNPASVARRRRAAPFGVAALAVAAAAAAGVDVVPFALPPPPGAGTPPPALAARLAARAPATAPDTDGGWLLVPPAGGWAWNPAAGTVTPQPSPPPPSSGARAAWAGGVAAALVCHTRRGDADAVADVLPQLMALDAHAEAWRDVGVV